MFKIKSCHSGLQQYLPFTVLKLSILQRFTKNIISVAIALTVYGIETVQAKPCFLRFGDDVAIAFTVYGIETALSNFDVLYPSKLQ